MGLPSLKQLQYLAALYEHQHFGRAAAACNVSQSTLSAGLKELEAVLRARLVERTRRVTVFTPLGVRVVRRAQALLLQANELSMLAQMSVAPLIGTLRLSIIPTVAPFLLPRILPAIRQTYPGLEFLIHEEMSHEGCAALASGARDGMILALPYECGDFDYAPLLDDPIVVAMRGDDPLAAMNRIEAAALPDERLLLLAEGHCLRDHALRACERPDVRARSAPGASIHTLVRLVEAGMGVALLPQMAVEGGATAGAQVVVRALAGEEARRTIVLAWRRNSPRSEDFALLAEKISEICADPLPPALAPAQAPVVDRCGLAA